MPSGSSDGSTRSALLGILIVGAISLLVLKPRSVGLRLQGETLSIVDDASASRSYSAAARRVHELLELDPPQEERLPVIYIEPPNVLEGVVIILHIAEKERVLAERLAPHFEHMRWIIPQAPVRSFNCTKCGTGTGWYDVASFATLNDVDRFPFPSVSVPADCDSSALDLNEPRQTAAAQAGTALDEDLPGLIESARTVYALIRYELNRGVPASMIHLAGYSQGAALAIFVAATYPEPLAGVHAVAGYWPAREVLRCLERGHYQTPFVLQHGTIDQWLHYDLGNASATYMRELGYTNVHLITHAGLNHETVWWSPRVLPSWAIFLDQTLPRARTRSSDPDAPPWLSSLYG